MNVFPKQKVTLKEKLTVHKGEKYPSWIMNTVDYFIGSGGHSEERDELISLLKAAEGDIDEDLYKYVLNPYNTDTSKVRKFPAKLRNYNILSPVINSFLGERSKKPDNFQVVAVNEDAPNLFLEEMHKGMTKLAKQKFINSLNETGVDTGMQSEKDMPSSSEHYKALSTNYTDARAIKGQESLNILKYELDLKDQMQKAFYYWLVLGRVITHKSVVRNDVKYTVIPPDEMYFSKSTESDYIEDGNMAYRAFRMNINDIVDKWRSDLLPDDIDELEALADDLGSSSSTVASPSTSIDDNNLKHDSDGLINIWHLNWKSFKQIGILSYYDELGVEREQEVSEDYTLNKEAGDIKIKWEWINESWECYRIGEKRYVGYQPLEVQRDEINNSSVCKLSYNGRTWHNQTKKVKSILKDGLDYQMLYNIYHYRAEMTMARNKDKIMMMPIGALPAQWGQDGMDNFMYYAEATGIGWIDESRPNVLAALQAIKAIDLSLSQYFGAMHEAMATIKQEWWDSVGMNRQRLGDVKASDGKGNNDQAVFRSSVITSELFRQFAKVEERDLNGLMDYSKIAWIDGKRGAITNSEGRSQVYDIDGLQHMESQYNVFVTDSSDEHEKLQTLKNQALSFAQNGAKPGVVAEVLDSENFSMIKSKLAELDDIEQARAEQEAKADRESNERIQQMVVENDEKNREADKYKVDMDYKQAIDVKKIEHQIALDTMPDVIQPDNSMDIIKENNANNFNRAKLTSDENMRREENNIKRETLESNERVARENKNQHDDKK